MKYFDDPVHNSKFNQFIDLLAELIEKYGGDIEFPETEKDNSWENNSDTVHSEKEEKCLTNHDAA